MKYTIIILIILQISCSPVIKFSVTNYSQTDRYNELLSFDIIEITKKEVIKEFGIYYEGKEIQKQIDNHDLHKKLVCFMDDFKAGESKQYTMKGSKSKLKVQNYSNIRFSLYKSPDTELNSAKRLTISDTIKASELYQMEGPAWENNKVAFRNYFDSRNGFDIFGKQVDSMVLDGVGLEGTNYHELTDWGMDILKVGNSLGAGSLAIQIGDSIFPIRNAEMAYFNLVTDGPLISSFDLTYNNFRINDRTYNITHNISIIPDKYYYESTVKIDGMKGDEKLVTGIVNMKSKKLHKSENNEFIVHYTHDKQSENNDFLGMGIMVNKVNFDGLIDSSTITNGISDTYMISLKIKNREPVKFRFYAGWERTEKQFANRAYFEKMMLEDAGKTPLKIEFFNK